MSTIPKYVLVPIISTLFFLGISNTAYGVTFPAQQSWSWAGTWYGDESVPLSSPTAIVTTTTPDGERVVILDGEQLRIYDTNGVPIGSTFIGANMGKMGASPDGLVYVIMNTGEVKVLHLDGQVERTISINAQSPSAITVDHEGRVYLADDIDFSSPFGRITIFSSVGELETQWEFGKDGPTRDIGLNPDNLLFISHYVTFTAFDRDGIQQMDYFGEYNGRTVDGFSFTSDGSFFGATWGGPKHRLGGPYLSSSPFRVIMRRQSGYGDAYDVAIGSDDSVYFLRNSPNRVEYMRRSYSGILDPDGGSIPLPKVISTSLIEGTNHVRIRYEVTDTDSESVNVLAWVVAEEDVMPNRNYWDHYSFSLAHAVPIQSVVGGSNGVLGENVPTNTEVILDWDAEGDIGATPGKYKIYMMANDGRDLLNLHFITIPEEGELPSLTLSRSPIDSNWFYNALLWFYFSSPSEYEFSESGEIYPVSGDWAGQWLTYQSQANGNPGPYSIIPQEGMYYVIEKLGYRRATHEEVLRAQEAGTPGTITQEPSGLESSPSARPGQVNEWGFDTGSADAYRNETEERDWLFWLVKE